MPFGISWLGGRDVYKVPDKPGKAKGKAKRRSKNRAASASRRRNR